MSKRRRSSLPSYSKRLKFIRQFYSIPNGKLTPQRKATITRLFNAATRANKSSGTRFKKLSAKERKFFEGSGYTVTNKGAFLPAREGQRITQVKDGYTKLTASTTATKRTDFEFHFTGTQARQFTQDPRGFIDSLKTDNPEVFAQMKGRKRYQLVFGLGAQELHKSLDEMELYLKFITDDAEDTDNEEARDKLASIERSLVAVRVTTFESKKGTGRSKRTRNNRTKPKTRKSQK